MFWLFLLLGLIEMRVDSSFILSMPDDFAKDTVNTLQNPDSMIKLPLYARWINKSKNNLLVLSGDSILFYSPYTFLIDSVKMLPYKGAERIYTDKKGRIIFVEKNKSFYLNGKKSKIRILSDTVNVVMGKKVFSKYKSPVSYGKTLFYMNNHKRVIMNVPFDTTASVIISRKYNELPSFLGINNGKYLVYTFSGEVYLGDSLLKDGLIHGIARVQNDTVFVSDLKDTDSVFIYSYPDLDLMGKIGFKKTPFSILRSDFDGNVYFNGKLIYRDKYLVSTCLYDIDKDGKDEIILGRMDGSFAVLKKYKGMYQEFMSYKPLKETYKRYFPIDGMPLFYMTEVSKSPFASILDTLNPMYRDEYIYVLLHASPEFLDSLRKVGMDFLYENIFDIYLAARRLKYVSLYELPDGRTTLIFNKKDTIPPDIYYEYVVFPRILYEFPQRPLFREFFMNDRSFGKSAIEVVENDTTVMDAVRSFYRWAKSFMHFGYMTNDLQPVIIYKKAYGSCGEHSILSAALFKTILIPSYVAVDMGEDHQWNEFYNGERWVHFDLTQNEKKAIDNPFASSEGMGHKEVSTVVGVSPSGRYFPITSHGYTKTGRIYVKVRDNMGNPVPFALCILRSHWNGRNMVSFFKYTDKNGMTFFDAGREKFGYGLDVYSPYGRGGVGNFYIDEGDTINLSIPFSGAIKSYNGKKENAKMLVLLRNFRTGESNVFLKDGFVYQTENGIFNPLLNTIGAFIKKDTLLAENEMPTLNVSLRDSVIRDGKPLIFDVHAKDNLGIKSVWAVLSGNGMEKEFKLSRFNGLDTIFVNEDTVMPEGTYELTFYAEDFSNNKSIIKKGIEIKKTNNFKEQLIKQDPIGTDKGSWNYVIEIKDTLPFIYIRTDGKTENMDIDLFLKKDGKVIKKSTSPTVNETIYLHPLPSGRYTITVQGWHVPKNRGMFNIKVIY